jgi:UTP--glucose-1-phosphate uridylyltransferase
VADKVYSIFSTGLILSRFSWYPPGHGDFYRSFYDSGLLQQFIKQGREGVFMSNIDNMGATVDLNILNLCLSEDHEFIMEVTDKTRDEYLS